MVAGRQVFRHPSCQKRHMILEKLSMFHMEHGTPLDQISRDLKAATSWIPTAEYALEAEPLQAGLCPPSSRRAATAAKAAPNQCSSRCRRGPRQLSDILPEVLVRLGVTMVESSPKGETDLT
jgi:hypothetical protein